MASTIKDIARDAGVSTATVSYVLNGKNNVAEETRGRVMEAAKRQRYVPLRNHRRPRFSSSAKHMSLAFVNCCDESPWGESYWGQFLAGAINASHETESLLQVANCNQLAEKVSDLPLQVRTKAADGLLVIGWPDEKTIRLLRGQGVEMVLVDTRDIFPGFSHIRPDHYGGARKAVQYLNSLGHRRIGVIAHGMSFACERDRLAAYYSAMMECGLEWSRDWIAVPESFDEANSYHNMKDLLDKDMGLTAVICHGDRIARAAVNACLDSGLSVPDDISILGCDNQPWSAEFRIPLTTIDVSLVELGRLAVRHLLERIKNPGMSPQILTVEAKILERDSAGQVKD